MLRGNSATQLSRVRSLKGRPFERRVKLFDLLKEEDEDELEAAWREVLVKARKMKAFGTGTEPPAGV